METALLLSQIVIAVGTCVIAAVSVIQLYKRRRKPRDSGKD